MYNDPNTNSDQLGTNAVGRRHTGMGLERLFMWMTVVGVIGFALTLIWMLTTGTA